VEAGTVGAVGSGVRAGVGSGVEAEVVGLGVEAEVVGSGVGAGVGCALGRGVGTTTAARAKDAEFALCAFGKRETNKFIFSYKAGYEAEGKLLNKRRLTD